MIARSLHDQAISAYDQRDYAKALDLLLAGIASGSSHWGLVWRLAIAAYQEFEKARQLGLDHWRMKWYQAQAAFGAGDIGQGRELLGQVLDEAPGFEEARAFLAMSETQAI